MLEDSAAVMAIGVFTFLMLPATTLGSIFGAQFFSSTTDSSSSGSNGSNNNSPTFPFVPRLQVASNFWIFWACVIPITTVSLVFGWRLRLFFLKRRQR